MKKIISIVMAIVLVATSAIALSATVFAESKFTATLESKTVEVGYDKDGEITINLVLANNPGIASFACDLKYDKDVFTLTKTVNGEVFPTTDPDCLFDNKVSMMWTYGPMDEINITRNGVLATFTFSVSKDATAGDYTIKVNPLFGGFADVVGTGVSADFVDAKIEIKKPPVDVSGISLDKTSADMYVGDTFILTATVEPSNATDKTVTWSSSNASVISVNNGVVTALKEGTATITAKAGDKTATCVVNATVKPCEHVNKTLHDAKDSTCKDAGWDAYYTCDDCSAVFDAKGNKIDGVPFLALADHTTAGGSEADCENSAVCGVCGQSFGSALGHTFNKEEADAKYLVKAATCNSYAVYSKSCSVCGKASADKTFDDVAGGYDAANHCGETYLVGDKAATETEEGYTGDTYCKGCDAKLEDGKVIPKLPHEAGDIVPGVKSTCVSHGTSAYYVCKNCGEKFFDKDCTEKVENDEALVLPLDATNHTGETEIVGHVAPTEDAEGNSGDLCCKDCHKVLVPGRVLPKLEHTPVLVEEVKANCHVEGCKAYYHCDNCDKNFSDEEGTLEIADMAELVIPVDAANHDGGTEVKDAVAATVDKEGYSGDTYCKGCGALLEKGEVTAKLPAPTEEETKKDDTTKADDTTAAGSPDSVPSTGDNFSVVVFVLLALVSTGALGMVVTSDRKKRRA